MRDIRELKCNCGAKWENLMWLDFQDVTCEHGEITLTESYECLECGEVLHVEFEATIKKMKKL